MEDLALNTCELYLDFYTYEFSDEKELKKFVNTCKRLVRSSYEYQEWVKYIKFTKNYSQCQFTRESIYELTVDIHHHPYSLESLVKVAIETLMSSQQKVSSIDVAKEVLVMHYQDLVGYVLLIKSLHEKFHNGFLKIPIELVNGNWKDLSNKYIIPDDIKQLVDNYTLITIKDVPKLQWNSDYIIYDDGQ